MGTLYEAVRQSELASQKPFAAGHLTVILFVIHAGEVQHAVKDQHLEFRQRAVTEFLAVRPRDIRRDRDISGDSLRLRRKRDHVRRLILLPEGFVQFLYLAISGDHDRNLALQLGGTSCTGGKAS